MIYTYRLELRINNTEPPSSEQVKDAVEGALIDLLDSAEVEGEVFVGNVVVS